MSAHTPTPWVAIESSISELWVERPLAVCYGLNRNDDASRIATCVNVHDLLITALTKIAGETTDLRTFDIASAALTTVKLRTL